MKRIICLGFVAAVFAGVSLFFASCSNVTASNTTENEDGSTRIKIELQQGDERTIMPSYACGNLTNIKLYGLVSTGGTVTAVDANKLDSWNTYAELANDDGVVLNTYGVAISGTWNFLLTATSNSSTMTSDIVSATINTGATTSVAFTLAVDSGQTNGDVKIILDQLNKFNVASVKYEWLTSQASYSSGAALALVTDSVTGNVSATFTQTGVAAGNYWVNFAFYDASVNLLMAPWQSSVIVQAGALSYKKLDSAEMFGTCGK